MEQKEYTLDELLPYEQPTNYIVESTKYDDAYKTPVLTAGKSFILGYTDETEGIFDEEKLPVIIFDDFTTATQYVNFPFKVKSSAMKILNVNKNLVLPQYIFYRMQVIQLDHSTHKRYWIQQYSKIKLSIPPIEEQERVISKIEELFSQLDNGVDTLKIIKEQLKVYRDAVLKAAFEGGWNYVQRKPISSELCFSEVDTKELEELPNVWKYVYLSELGELARGKSKHRPRNDKRLFENGKYPFFQTGDIKSANEFVTESGKKYGDFGLQQSKLWPKGTLCITIAANIAETCFLGVEACFPDSIVGFTPKEGIVNKEYVRYFIEASKQRLSAYAPATAQKNINLTTLENLVIPYCDIAEQNYIVDEIKSRLSQYEVLEKTVDEALLQAEAMRQSILKKAFEGELI